jgi:hypothetical protein
VNATICGRQPEQPEESVDDYCDRRLSDPSERQRSNRYSELRPRDVSIEMRQSALNVFRGIVAVLRHLVDSASPNGDERELGGHEKRVESHQKQNDTKAGGDCTGAKVFGRTLQKGQEIHIQ